MPAEDCEICGGHIEVMIYRGSGVCGENCRKERERKQIVATMDHLDDELRTACGLPKRDFALETMDGLF